MIKDMIQTLWIFFCVAMTISLVFSYFITNSSKESRSEMMSFVSMYTMQLGFLSMFIVNCAYVISKEPLFLEPSVDLISFVLVGFYFVMLVYSSFLKKTYLNRWI